MHNFNGVYQGVVGENVRLLNECHALLEPVTEAQYRQSTRHAPENSLGRQVRHCIDHYHCLLSNLDGGAVDYDDRSRDKSLELHPSIARDALESVIARLASLTPEEHRASVELKLDDGGTARSSVARELAFLASHTTHHFALIAELGRQLGLCLDADLGVSTSTRRVREHSQA
ncbi:MAG: DinB family protein [Congregibacter sp.]